jgi:hypothetical protein
MTAAARLKDNLRDQATEDRQQGEVFRCTQPFCSRAAQRTAGTGFSLVLCEQHIERLQRHGHPIIPSIPGPMLRPYVETSRRWIQGEAALGNIRVKNALFAILSLMETAGRAASAMDIAHWSPEQKAKVCFARLREASITSERIMSSHMGIVALLADDPWQPRSEDYKLTQTAKAIWRCAAGTHREWEIAVPMPAAALREGEDAGTRKASLHVYPRPRGQALRIIGKALDEACGAIAEEQAQAIIAATETRFGRHPCHTEPGYEPAWRKADRAKHEAALRQRQQAEAEQQRQANIRQVLGDAFGPSLSWQSRR